MITLPIFDNEIELAKKITSQFDSQKTHNKFKCETNWLGYLGELIISKYFKYRNIDYNWINFVKQDYGQPDFKIGSKTIDVKTTFDDRLWIQNIEHNIYILINISRDLKKANIIGYVDSSDLINSIERKEYNLVIKNNKKNYVFDKNNLKDINKLFKTINKFREKGWDF